MPAQKTFKTLPVIIHSFGMDKQYILAKTSLALSLSQPSLLSLTLTEGVWLIPINDTSTDKLRDWWKRDTFRMCRCSCLIEPRSEDLSLNRSLDCVTDAVQHSKASLIKRYQYAAGERLLFRVFWGIDF